MKVSMVLAVMGALLVCRVALGKECHTRDDCDGSECCIEKGVSRSGECHQLRKQGESCSDVEDYIITTGKYVNSCPCQSGLKCVPEHTVYLGVLLGKLKMNESCIAAESAVKGTAESELKAIVTP